jgi:hypothetical protein
MVHEESWVRRNGWNTLFLLLAVLSLPFVYPFIGRLFSVPLSYLNAVNRVYEHGSRSGELGGLPYFNANISEYRVAWNAGGYGYFDAFSFLVSYIVLPIVLWSATIVSSALGIYLFYELLRSWIRRKQVKHILELTKGYVRIIVRALNALNQLVWKL